MVEMARKLIKADRTGSWLMHLQAVSNCLPVFAAAGHFNYLRSAHYYLQQMSDLETHPDVHQKFLDGFHVVHRSNQCWAGLSSDLIIEQTLMRSLKSNGGLTHCSGMRNLWTLSAPVTSKYNVHGIVAGPEVNVHDFESVGNKIIEDMLGKSAFTYKFKGKDRAHTLGNISAMKIAPDRTTDRTISRGIQVRGSIP